MTIAETLMQFMYGGESLGTPEWLAVATEQMQTLNKGYHWGRYINCIEVNMTIFSAILLNQGKFFPSVSSLPKLPAFLPGYTKQVHSRLKNLDDSKSTKFKLSKKFSYNDWVTYLNKKSIPAYSYVILFAQIKKIGGGHVLSGFVTPKQNGDGVELQLFDAQGFLPNQWLHPQQIDQFYLINIVYIYDSRRIIMAVKQFIENCKTPLAAVETSISQENPLSNQLYNRLLEFIKLELFRLEAKLLIYSQDDVKCLTDKVMSYQQLEEELSSFPSDKSFDLFVLEQLMATAAIVKNHSYSFNWLDPQSLSHYRACFSSFIVHQALDIQSEQALELNKIIDYLKSFLFKEIIRLTFVNEMNTYYLNEKITDFYTQFIQLDMPQPTWHNIEDSLEAIKKICAKKRHYFHLTGSSNSLTTYQQFLEPLKKSLKELLLSEWEILDSIKERECFSTCHLGLKSSPFD